MTLVWIALAWAAVIIYALLNRYADSLKVKFSEGDWITLKDDEQFRFAEIKEQRQGTFLIAWANLSFKRRPKPDRLFPLVAGDEEHVPVSEEWITRAELLERKARVSWYPGAHTDADVGGGGGGG